jgi:signal transduction histidine kinase
VIAGTRELANGIFAVSIPDRDLAAALRSLAERAAARSGVAVRFTSLGSSGLSLTDSTVSSLFRIAQESTTNALRHSGAASVNIVLDVDAAGVSLSIADNGRGCPDGAEQSGGAGLRIMRFRAHAIGAQLSITRLAAGGTKIECTLPLSKG